MNLGPYHIRPLHMEDAVAYFTLVDKNRSRIATYFPTTVTSTKSIDDTAALIHLKIRKAEKEEAFTFLITEKENILGVIFLKEIDWNIPKCELGFFIDRDHEGKGIITGCLNLIVRYCFDELKMQKIFMRIPVDNTASRRVAEKNGFRQEGILKNDFKIDTGELIDVVYYGLVGSNI